MEGSLNQLPKCFAQPFLPPVQMWVRGLNIGQPSKQLSQLPPSPVLMRNGYFSTEMSSSNLVTTQAALSHPCFYPTSLAYLHSLAKASTPKGWEEDGRESAGGRRKPSTGRKTGGPQTEGGNEGKGLGARLRGLIQQDLSAFIFY